MTHHDAKLEREYIASFLDCEPDWQREHLADAGRLDPADCYAPPHEQILEALHTLVRRGERANFLTLRDALEQQQAKRATLDALDEITGHGTNPFRLFEMAGRLTTLARARRTREQLQRALGRLETLDLEGAQEHAREAAGHASRGGTAETVSAHACAWQAVQHVNVTEHRSDGRMARTGFGVLDYALRVLRPRTMHTVGGRTGCGKSSLMLAMAVHQAREQGRRPGIVSCEDEQAEYGSRLLAHVSNVNPDELLDQQVTEHTCGHIELGLQSLQGLPIEFAYTLNKPLADVLKAIRSLVTDKRCDVIFVDYLQAIRVRAQKGERHDRAISDAAQDLKAECQSLGVPLVLASQMKRPEGGKAYAEPNMHDLKESGDIENMSESIVLLWKDSDRDDARQLGKVAKVKGNARRPRFELQRKENGAITDVVPYEPPREETAAPMPRSWAGSRRYA